MDDEANVKRARVWALNPNGPSIDSNVNIF